MAQKGQPDHKAAYVMFECCLIPHLNKNSGAILSYSVVKLSQSLSGSDYQVLISALELSFQGKLPAHLTRVIAAAGINAAPGDKYGLNDAYNTLISFLSSNDQVITAFIQQCTVYYQIREALTFLKLSAGSYEQTLKNYNSMLAIVTHHKSRYGSDVLVSLKADMLINYRDQDKTHRDFELLKAFAAVKSIQGTHDFAITNKGLITARMIGAKTPEIAKAMCKDKAILKLYSRFNGRYFYDRLIEDLELNKFIMSQLTGNRCIYISTSLPYELLKTAIESTQKATQRTSKISALKSKKQQFKVEL